SVRVVKWDFHQPESGDWAGVLAEADSVIHLAGTPLFKQRWTPSFKEEMSRSRVEGTRQLVDAIIASKKRPASFITASAVGIYGTDPSLAADENAAPADDLLARICVDWENQAKRLDAEGLRTAQIRIGIVLSREAGALKEVLPVFKMGLGGVMGHPDHWMNWIHEEDVARIFVMALNNEEMRGPYNAVAPTPALTADYYRTLCRVLGRPCLMKYPPAVIKVMIGEAGEYASGGAKALSGRLTDAGYTFFFDKLDKAFENLLG
ncbi:unnamed protein product, partial [marine sediment metagenome]